ncbi:MAG: YaaC family protein [Polyangiaceae bacterium]
MAFSSISYSSRRLTIHKAVTKPRFNEKTVLVTDAWDYVDLWLKRAKEDRARFHWSQARSFYLASAELPPTAAPLTAYYCFLNATKALLLTKGVQFGDRHGVTGYTIPGKTALSNEQVIFKRGGILAALCQHLGEPTNGETYSLKSLLYNLPYVHRAYDLTYASSKELFIPVHSPEIVRSTTTHEAWFVAELRDRYANDRTTKAARGL